MKTRALTWLVMLIVFSSFLPVAPMSWPPAVEEASGKTIGHPAPATTLPDDAPELGEIVERYIEAAGGRDAIARIKTRIVKARIVTDLPTWDPPVFEVDTLVVYSIAPDRYFIEERTEQGTVLKAGDGTTAWKRGADGNAFDYRTEDVRSAWLVDPQYPLRLTAHFPDMKYLGVAALEGRPVHVVETDGDHLHRLYFDTEFGLLVRLGYNRKLGDYREVDGVKLPFAVEHSRKGGSSTFFFDNVIHNVHIDDRLFVPPDRP